MNFAATSACAHCRLRFSRREKCPTCGGTAIFSLATRDGLKAYRAATRVAVSTRTAVLVALAPWAPRRPLVVGGLCVLAMLPVIVALVFDRNAFFNLWLMSDLTMSYQGLSAPGLAMIVAGAVGAFGLVFNVLASYGTALTTRAAEKQPKRMRVHSASTYARGDTSLNGIARRASVEIPSALGEEECLIFGLRGEVGDAEVADADGGDFDLELPTGERVMVSLEHALFVVPGDPPSGGEPLDGDTSAVLDALLEERGIGEASGRAILEEHLVRDGDEVTVIGNVLGGTVTSLGYRGASRTRVIAGDEERPLVVEITTKA